MQTKNVIVEKSLDFSVEIIQFCELLETHKKFVIARQLLRSGTSIGAKFLKHNMRKAKEILFIKLKSQLKKQMKPCTGYYCVNEAIATQRILI